MRERVFLATVLAVACVDATGPIVLDPSSITLTIGSRRQLTVLSGDQAVARGTRLTWFSTDTSVATVSPIGEVFGLKGGAAKVTVHWGRNADTTDVRVIPGTGGIWLGSVSDSFYTFALNEVIVETNPTFTVAGTVTVRDGRDSVRTFDVSGTHTFPDVALQLDRPGQPSATYTGTFSSDTTIAGQVEGLGPAARSLVLTRPTCYCPPFLAGRLASGEPLGPSCCTGA